VPQPFHHLQVFAHVSRLHSIPKPRHTNTYTYSHHRHPSQRAARAARSQTPTHSRMSEPAYAHRSTSPASFMASSVGGAASQAAQFSVRFVRPGSDADFVAPSASAPPVLAQIPAAQVGGARAVAEGMQERLRSLKAHLHLVGLAARRGEAAGDICTHAAVRLEAEVREHRRRSRAMSAGVRGEARMVFWCGWGGRSGGVG
jgi:hypothetical protein